MALSGNIVIVGAKFDDDAGADSGSAYLFDVTTGNQLFKLTASDAAAIDQFGWRVAISGNTAVIGARFDDDAGSAYIFNNVPEPATGLLLAVAALAVLRRRIR